MDRHLDCGERESPAVVLPPPRLGRKVVVPLQKVLQLHDRT